MARRPALPVSFRLALLVSGLSSCAAPELQPAATSAPDLPPREPAAAPAVVAPSLRLEFVDDFNPPRPADTEALDAPGVRWDAALGGLSGLHYDRASATLYAVSDLNRRFEPRMYTFHVELTESSLHVAPKAVHFFREATPSGWLDGFDAESLTGDGRGAFYLGTENLIERPNQAVPRILRLRGDGLLMSPLTLPEAYLPAPDGAPRGTRSNQAFEGLSLSPSGRWLTAIVESSLEQDGDEATFEHGASVRLVRWDMTRGGDPAEYFYPIEPIERPLRGTPTGGNNGVSELLSLDERRLLVLERAYVPLEEGQGPSTIRIFEATLPEALPPPVPPPMLQKRLVLDLDDIVPRLEPGAQSLDNVEGMTLGPELPSGDASLLLVTDDNFRAQQRTVFLAFRARGLPR